MTGQPSPPEATEMGRAPHPYKRIVQPSPGWSSCMSLALGTPAQPLLDPLLSPPTVPAPRVDELLGPSSHPGTACFLTWPYNHQRGQQRTAITLTVDRRSAMKTHNAVPVLAQ